MRCCPMIDFNTLAIALPSFITWSFNWLVSLIDMSFIKWMQWLWGGTAEVRVTSWKTQKSTPVFGFPLCYLLLAVSL